MYVSIATIPRCSDNIFKHFVLKHLDNFDIRVRAASSQLDSIDPDRCEDLFVQQKFIMHQQLGVPTDHPLHF